MIFSDTSTASPKGTLTDTTTRGAGFSSTSHGYVVGGFPSPPKSTVQRVDFSNDTATASLRTNLNAWNGEKFWEWGNNNYGYQLGGYVSTKTTVERVDFSNDLGIPSVKGSIKCCEESL